MYIHSYINYYILARSKSTGLHFQVLLLLSRMFKYPDGYSSYSYDSMHWKGSYNASSSEILSTYMEVDFGLILLDCSYAVYTFIYHSAVVNMYLTNT